MEFSYRWKKVCYLPSFVNKKILLMFIIIRNYFKRLSTYVLKDLKTWSNFYINFSSFGIGFGIGIGFGMQSLSVSVSVGSLPIPKLPKFRYRPKFWFRSFTNFNRLLAELRTMNFLLQILHVQVQKYWWSLWREKERTLPKKYFENQEVKCCYFRFNWFWSLNDTSPEHLIWITWALQTNYSNLTNSELNN